MDNFGNKDTVRRNSETFSILNAVEYGVMIIFALVWFFLLVWYWKGGNESTAGFSMIAFTVLLPVLSAAISFFYGVSRDMGFFRWIMVLFFAFMYLLLDYLTFRMTEMLSLHQILIPDWHILIKPAVFSFCGLLVGSLLRLIIFLHKRKEREDD